MVQVHGFLVMTLLYLKLLVLVIVHHVMGIIARKKFSFSGSPAYGIDRSFGSPEKKSLVLVFSKAKAEFCLISLTF